MSKCRNDEEIQAIQNSISECEKNIKKAVSEDNESEFIKWVSKKDLYHHELKKRLSLVRDL